MMRLGIGWGGKAGVGEWEWKAGDWDDAFVGDWMVFRGGGCESTRG